jgi:prepilin peptidase CpaA
MPPVSQEVAWFVSVILIEAALIDGWKLKVPNWLTFHMVLGGLGFAAYTGGSAGFFWALSGAVIGLALLMPLHMIGGMGAGDVKLMAGIGAWMGPSLTVGAFIASALVGGVMAVAMVLWSGQWIKHWVQFHAIGHEILTVRNPAKLATTAAARKPTMMLLPYGIPIAVGSIAYFAWVGILG